MIELIRPGRVELWIMLLLWPAVLIGFTLLTARSGRGHLTGGLVLFYLGMLFMMHWPGAALLLQEWYEYYPIPLTWAGFVVTTYGMLAFTAGALLLVALKNAYSSQDAHLSAWVRENLQRFCNFILLFGLVVVLILTPVLGAIPTLSAILAALGNLVVVGVCLMLMTVTKPAHRVALLLSTLLFPFFTVIINGFIGFGMSMLLTVFVFWLSLNRVRLIHLVLVPPALILAAAIYITYMGERALIRESVWGGAAISERGEVLRGAAANFQWFDPNDPWHLKIVDLRLNQNFLVGTTIEHLQSGREHYANGETIVAASVAIIPRVIWPDKPSVGGGGDVVARYSGLDFDRTTSVGVGHVLEFYINFGLWGVIGGMFAFGVIVAEINNRIAISLQSHRYDKVCVWLLSGLAFTQPLGSFAELSTSFIAGIAAGVILLMLAERYFGRGLFLNKPQTPVLAAG